MKKSKIIEAIEYLGGINDAAKKLSYTRQWIWYFTKNIGYMPSINLCRKIEKVTKGKFTIKSLRPDIFN